MDTALILRLAHEKKIYLDNNEIIHLLSQSKLIKKLTADFMEHPLFATFRIMGLCEIPYIEELSYTQKLIDYINTNIATTEGFSCLGGIEEIVPCYNAMLLEAYCRFGFAASKEAQAALNWIEQYQLFDRNQKSRWTYKGICKHGGCLGKTPCYIGVGKTIRSLVSYLEFAKDRDKKVENLLKRGLDYMLKHSMFQRLSDGKPISPHITDIMFPQSYMLSLTDLIYIVGKRQLKSMKNSVALLHLLKEKQILSNQWKIDYLYTYKGYINFEGRKKASEWISTLFPIWLSDEL